MSEKVIHFAGADNLHSKNDGIFGSSEHSNRIPNYYNLELNIPPGQEMRKKPTTQWYRENKHF